MEQSNKILQEALVNHNILTEGELKQHISLAESTGESLRTFLLQSGTVTEQQMCIALSQSLNLQTVSFKGLDIDPSVMQKVPIKIAWYYKFMPIKIENGIMTIASAAPLTIKIQDEIRTHIGMEVKVVLATESDLTESLKKNYGFASDTIDRIMMKEPVKKSVSSAETGQWIEDLEKQTDDPTISHLVNEIILEAYNKRATDIHMEPYRNKVRFRYRIDGMLVDANLPDDVKHFLPQILSRIKILANLSITEKRLPQDGSAVVKTKDQHLDLRVSTMPTPRGESMVIRVLPTKVMSFSLEKLGFNEGSITMFRDLIKKPHGIIFITGPTGSGKTTTLYACLNEINSSHRKIITIEDPVEYEMDGITQVQVNSKVKFNFSTGLRSLLRHDPDIIMVGEVRDLETAEIAIRTALTGHLVFSTLHTNDASSGITRLIDMGVEPYLVASSVESFVAQRLVRIICPQCKEECKSSIIGIKREICRSLKIESDVDIKIYRGRGCDYCNQTGYYGRIAIYEILILDDVIRAAVIDKPRSDYIKRIAVKEGLVTLRQNGWRAVLDGITTPDEVINVTIKDEELDDEQKVGINEARDEKLCLSMQPPKEVTKRKDEINESKNSRVYPRSLVPVELRYRHVKKDPNDPNEMISEGIEYPTVTEDISAGGVKFISRNSISIGSTLAFKIHLSKVKKPIECLAKVCRIDEEKDENLYTINTYFSDISNEDKETISNFVAGNKII